MEQRDLLKYVIEVLERSRLDYMLVGSFASAYFGEPRQTFDIDIVIDLPRERIADLSAAFPPPQFYLSGSAMDEAIRLGRQFNVIDFTSGYKIDFMLVRKDDWGRAQFARRQLNPLLSDQMAYTAAVEDVILGKLWYYEEGGSDKHLRDIAGILRVHRQPVDHEYIERWVTVLGFQNAWSAVKEKVAEPDSE